MDVSDACGLKLSPGRYADNRVIFFVVVVLLLLGDVPGMYSW